MKKLSTLFVLLCLSVTAGAQYTLTTIDVNNTTGSSPSRFTSFKDKTYFIANDGTHGYELWWADGHSYGLVADIWPGAGSAFNQSFTTSNNLCVLGDKLYFPASDSAHGVEIWEYNGTTPPKMVIDSDTMGDYIARGQITAVDGWLYYKARESFISAQTQILRLHPVSRFTQAVPVTPTSMNLADPMVELNGKLVFTGTAGSSGNELYEYDPQNGFTLLYDINPATSNSVPGDFYKYGNVLFFTASNATTGRELWRYDGFSVPRNITDIRPGAASSLALSGFMGERMAVYNNKLYFTAYNSPAARYQLYSYEPLTDSVRMVTEMNSWTPALGMAVYGRRLFVAIDSNSGMNPGLFFYDGSTTKHFSALGFNTFDIPRYLTASNGRLYFSDLDFNSSSTSYEAYVFTDSITLDVPELGAGDPVTVYPNPATADAYLGFSLKQAAILTIMITDAQGKLVFRVTQPYAAGRNEAMIPASRMATGVYVYTIANEEGVVLGRGQLVKQ